MWNADLGNGRYKNPILYADYSDPDAIRVGEDYYMIASSFCNAPALPLLHSKDLVNWKVVKYILPKVPEFRYRNPIHGCGVWAPAIRYHEGTYYVYFPMPDEGIYVTTAKNPLGEWSEPVNIRPAAGWIDPCPFWDEDGRAYLVAGVAKSRIGYKSVLHMVEMQSDGMGLIGEEKVIFDGNLNDQMTIEGPKMYKRNGYYYIFAPAGGVKTGWQTVLRSTSVFGPYEYKVVLRKGNKSAVNGPHQGAWVDTVTGEDWFIHFQDVYAAGRITHLQPMCWENDWPVIGVKEHPEDEYGCPVDEYRKPDVGGIKAELCEPDNSDEFEGNTLGLQWQWNANPDDDWAECKGEKSVLKLNAVETVPSRPVGDYRNLLLQKWPAPEFTCVSKVDISGMVNGDFAGFISMGVKYLAMGLKKSDMGFSLVTVEGKQQFDCDMAYTVEDVAVKDSLSYWPGIQGTDRDKTDCNESDYNETDLDVALNKSDIVYYRYTVKRTGSRDYTEGGLPVKDAPVESATIEISFDGVNYTNPVTIEAKAGRWVGVKSGLFISHDKSVKSDKRGYIEADYVRYHR